MITEYAVPSLALNYHCKKYQIIYESVYSYLCTCMRNKYSCKSEFVWNAHLQVMLKVISIGRFQKISIPTPQTAFRALSDPVLLLLEASVFPLFINFVYNVIVVFCRCLCRHLWLLCWLRCLHCGVSFLSELDPYSCYPKPTPTSLEIPLTTAYQFTLETSYPASWYETRLPKTKTVNQQNQTIP